MGGERPERHSGVPAQHALGFPAFHEPVLSDIPVRYDPIANVIKMDGPNGASIMLTTLLKAKFGDALDPLMLFHEPLANIMIGLQENSIRPGRSSGAGPFTRQVLCAIAEAVLNESIQSGRWRKSREQQALYLRNVVAAPHNMSDEQVETVFDEIKAGLQNRRRLLEAAAEVNV